MKVINDLVNYSGMLIVQNPDWFMFSLDSVLLPNFVTINKNTKKILELGTGNCPIPLILSTRTNELINSIEIQKDLYELARESVSINHLEDRINLINDDMKNLANYFKLASFDLIITNPPYFELEEKSKLNDNEHKTIARHELKITLEEILELAGKFLNNKGIFAMVYRTNRLIEVIEQMRKNKIEPKRLRLIYPSTDSESNMFLIEGVKNANKGLKILSPLYAHNKDGSYTEEVMQYFTNESRWYHETHNRTRKSRQRIQ